MSADPNNPATWQCCACDSLSDDDPVFPMEWEGAVIYACILCGHHMQVACCVLREKKEEGHGPNAA